MKMLQPTSTRAFTIVEAFIILALLAGLMAFVAFPFWRQHGCYAQRINCINNLKQVGLGFRTWALDNGDKYPMQVSITNGGTMELTATGYAFSHFSVLSNELSTPRILFCPQETDPIRYPATTFAGTAPVGSVNIVPFTNNNSLSYFVGVDATDEDPQRVLTGDRNLCVNGVMVRRRFLAISTNSVVTWTSPRHEKGGNLGLSDGSVMQIGDRALIKAFQQCQSGTNRLLLP